MKIPLWVNVLGGIVIGLVAATAFVKGTIHVVDKMTESKHPGERLSRAHCNILDGRFRVMRDFASYDSCFHEKRNGKFVEGETMTRYYHQIVDAEKGVARTVVTQRTRLDFMLNPQLSPDDDVLGTYNVPDGFNLNK